MTTPEQAIWQTVLMQAVNDALIGYTENNGAYDKAAKIAATHTARTYLTQPSKDLATVCALAGLDPVAVCESMARQIATAPTPEQLFSGSRRRDHSTSQRYTHEGQTHTLKEWAVITGIAEHKLRNRIRKDWCITRALTTQVGAAQAKPKADPKPKRSTAKMLTHEGQTRTIAQWSKVTGIPQTILHMRERSGWNAEKIITTPYTPRRQRGVVLVFGERFGTGGGSSLQDGRKIDFSEETTQ